MTVLLDSEPRDCVNAWKLRIGRVHNIDKGIRRLGESRDCRQGLRGFAGKRVALITVVPVLPRTKSPYSGP